MNYVSWNHTLIVPSTKWISSNALCKSAVNKMNYVSQNHTVDSRNVLDEKAFRGRNYSCSISWHKSINAGLLLANLLHALLCKKLVYFVHSAFCPQNDFCARKYVLVSIFCGHNANSLMFFVNKMSYGVSWFRNEFIEATNCGIIPKERALGKCLTSHSSLSMKRSLRSRKTVLQMQKKSFNRARSAIAEIWWLSRLLFKYLSE